MPRSVLRVGTRGSALALAQAEKIRRAVGQVITHRSFELVPVKGIADEAEHAARARIGGIYAGDLHDALLSGKVDLAVHSAKDLPAKTPEGILLAALPERSDPRDALVTRTGAGLKSLQPGTTIGAVSARRAAQVRALARGLDPTPIYGSLDTRLRKLSDGEVQSLIVSLASLRRLGRADRAAEILPINIMLPAAGQGTLAVECRANDKTMRAALAQLDDGVVRAAFDAERSFVLCLAGDGDLPVAALAECKDGVVRLRGLVASLDGRRVLTDQVSGTDPVNLGLELADRLREQGADELLRDAL